MRLKKEWAHHLERSGLPQEAAELAAGITPFPTSPPTGIDREKVQEVRDGLAQAAERYNNQKVQKKYAGTTLQCYADDLTFLLDEADAAPQEPLTCDRCGKDGGRVYTRILCGDCRQAELHAPQEPVKNISDIMGGFPEGEDKEAFQEVIVSLREPRVPVRVMDAHLADIVKADSAAAAAIGALSDALARYRPAPQADFPNAIKKAMGIKQPDDFYGGTDAPRPRVETVQHADVAQRRKMQESQIPKATEPKDDWLKRQLDIVRKEVDDWPDWKKVGDIGVSPAADAPEPEPVCDGVTPIKYNKSLPGAKVAGDTIIGTCKTCRGYGFVEVENENAKGWHNEPCPDCTVTDAPEPEPEPVTTEQRAAYAMHLLRNCLLEGVRGTWKAQDITLGKHDTEVRAWLDWKKGSDVKVISQPDAPKPEPVTTADRARWWRSLNKNHLGIMTNLDYLAEALAGDHDTEVREWLAAKEQGGDDSDR